MIAFYLQTTQISAILKQELFCRSEVTHTHTHPLILPLDEFKYQTTHWQLTDENEAQKMVKNSSIYITNHIFAQFQIEVTLCSVCTTVDCNFFSHQQTWNVHDVHFLLYWWHTFAKSVINWLKIGFLYNIFLIERYKNLKSGLNQSIFLNVSKLVIKCIQVMCKIYWFLLNISE